MAKTKTVNGVKLSIKAAKKAKAAQKLERQENKKNNSNKTGAKGKGKGKNGDDEDDLESILEQVCRYHRKTVHEISLDDLRNLVDATRMGSGAFCYRGIS